MSISEKNEENTNESSNFEDENKEDHNNTSTTDFNKSEDILDPDFEILSQDLEKIPDHVFKIIIIGNSGVGKTCLTYRATTGQFHDRQIPTLGFEFFPLFVKYKNNILKLELWDTCGQEVYRSLIKSFYINSSMAIIVYAKDDKKSFDSIPEWIRQCRNLCSPNTKYILIGNKKDLKK